MHFVTSRLFVFILLFPLASFSQNFQLLASQADSLYQVEAFEQAFMAYNQLLAQDSSQAQSFHRRGACYLDAGKLEAAKRDFRKALELDAQYANSYYNLGLIANQQEHYKRGITYFRAFILLEPHDHEGLMNMAANFVYLDEPDSFDIYFQRAFAIDSTDLRLYQIAAADYAYFKQYQEAEIYVEKAINRFPTEETFYDLALAIYDQQNKHQAALQIAERAKQQFPNEINWYHEAALKRVVSNTAREILYEHPNAQDKFSHISARKLKELDKLTKNKAGKYPARALREKYETSPQQLGFDEYFMLYVGTKKEERASREGVTIYREMIQGGLWDSVAHMIDIDLEAQVAQIDLHYLAASCYARLQDWPRFEQAIQHYYGFLLGIMYTGTGLAFDQAFLITHPEDAYYVMELLDLSVAKMEAITFDGKSYHIAYSGGQDEPKICFHLLK